MKVYTRGDEAAPGVYPDGLARSVHFAYSTDGAHFEALNQNYGILFAEGLITEQNTICPKGVRDPRILRAKNGGYLILAVRTEENGEEEAERSLECWFTRDFLEFSRPEGLTWEDWEKAGDVVKIDRCLCDRLALYWGRLCNTAVRVPQKVAVSSREELDGIGVTAVYSDGSTVSKAVDWDADGIDWTKEGTVTVSGTVRQQRYPFPLLRGYGDPVLMKWEGKWYYISTNDNTDNVGIYVREADTIPELFEEGAKEHLILDRDEERDFIQTFWAPEFHVIGGELYILLAIGGRVWAPQCHVMKLKRGGRITEPADWETPVRVRLKDGTPLGEGAISLDMTYVKGTQGSYMVWSYREEIGTEKDSGSMLYIAQVSEREPWRLTSDPVLLSRPLYGWENTEGTINNEGPYAFEKDGTIYLTYSGGSANRYSYALGLLRAEVGADLCDARSWKKSPTAVLSYYSVDGVYGPGHNSFFTDEEGNLMIAYHAVESIDSTIRCPGIRRIHFDIQGRPVFHMSEERDLKPELRRVRMQVNVRKP